MIKNNIRSRATSSSFLKNRINLNKKYQKTNFKNWQYKTYAEIIKKLLAKKGINNIKILDIGSGDGLQVSHFLKIFKSPEIWCLDYSKHSLSSLKKKYKSKNIKIFTEDMDNLGSFLNKNKLTKYFDIVHSSYALYYSKKQNKLLNSMKNSLSDNGIYLISAPTEPHEMVNFVNKISNIQKNILNTLKFYQNVLIPFLKINGKKIINKKKINFLKFKKNKEFINFWKNTTYYIPKAEKKIDLHLKKKKLLKFKKISAIAAAIKK